MMQDSSQLGQLAMRAMEDAILSALAEAGDCIGPKDISDMTGIYRGERPDGGIRMNDLIVAEMLQHLLNNGRVRRCTQSNHSGGWELIVS